jgi:thiamine-phosphate pyrophosphorylase
MAIRSETEPARPAARLYLVIAPTYNPSALARDLDPALREGEVAAALLRLPDAPEPALIQYVEAIVPVLQRKGIAVLLDGHTELVARTGADGAHLTGIAALTAAVASLKPERIAGAGGLATRHDAMLAAEAGADYVMFGEPAFGGGDSESHTAADRRPPFAAVVERIVWWADVFQSPCVGYAESLDEVAALAAAGADFVALGSFVFTDPRGPSAVLQAAAELLSASEPAK